MNTHKDLVGMLKRRQYEALLDNIPVSMIMEKAADYLVQTMKYEPISDELTSPTKMKDFARLKLIDAERENFIVIYLDNQHRVTEYETLFSGSIESCTIAPREVVKAALKHNAAACVFLHNHPSGSVKPSQADRKITRLLMDALQLVEVRVLDHLIVGGRSSECVSFSELGII
ncbi:UPF0758 protein VC_0510-like [Cetorhinus maximus]